MSPHERETLERDADTTAGALAAVGVLVVFLAPCCAKAGVLLLLLAVALKYLAS